MKKIFSILLMLLFMSLTVGAQETTGTATPPPGMRGRPVNLPDISAIGVMNGYLSDDKLDKDRNKLEFDEIETAFQGYIYPEMKADVFLALHKHRDEYEAEICEAKVSFLHLADSLAGELGKIHVNFGKLNKVHTHHRLMADQPPALTNFFGAHGLTGHGGILSYILPLPFFAQIEAGAWTVEKHHHHLSDENSAEVSDIYGSTVTVATIVHDDSEFSLADKVYTGRLKTSFASAEKSELEVGFSWAKGRGAHYEEHKDNAEVLGADLTFKSWPDAYKRWTFQNEFFYLKREVPVGTLHRHGLYSLVNYRWSKYWDAGTRFDYAENALPGKVIERAVCGLINYHLTETSIWTLEYKNRNISGEKINEVWVRFTFGIGPHSHELE
jgi:hypothetical protein